MTPQEEQVTRETRVERHELRSQVRWGRKRTLRLLSTCAIGWGRELGRLTDRQRTVLADEIRARSNQ